MMSNSERKEDKVGSLQSLKKKCKQFKSREGRASFYDIAVEVTDKYPLQIPIITIIILAT